MEKQHTVAAVAALAQEARLDILYELMGAEGGLAAGDVDARSSTRLCHICFGYWFETTLSGPQKEDSRG